MKQIFPLLGPVILAAFLAIPTHVAAGPAPDSTLCWSQFELLMSRQKLTESEADIYRAQCTCLEEKEQTNQSSGQKSCAQAAMAPPE